MTVLARGAVARERLLRADTVRALIGPRRPRRELELAAAIRALGIRIVRARRDVADLQESTR